MDSLFADVSYFQAPVDDSYPYRIFSFRSNDGTFHDPNFASNYEWACAAADSGRLACFIVYFYWRPNWLDTVNTHQQMVEAFGGPHPRMITMIDLESGGNPGGDQSDGINRTYEACAQWLGNPRRVIGYANRADFAAMWPTRPEGLRVIGAGYGANPNLPGQIAHQYTDGNGYGGGLAEGCAPFGNCDMNSADGLSPEQFAAACGIGAGGGDMELSDTWTDAYGSQITVADGFKWANYHGDLILDLLGGPGSRMGEPPAQKMTGHPALGGRTIVGALAEIGQALKLSGFDPSKEV